MSPEDRAALTASLVAVDPVGLGGVCLRSQAQPLRDQWLRLLRSLLSASMPFRRMPHGISDRHLFGGLDLSATIRMGRPIAEQGLLAGAHGGILLIAMAERMSERTASCLNAAMDSGRVSVPRDGVWLENPAQFGVVALDEGIGVDESIPGSLFDRLAFLVDLNALHPRTDLSPPFGPDDVARARMRLATVETRAKWLETICATCRTLGADSSRSALQVVRAARAHAALAARTLVVEEDVIKALELVVAPRATRLPEAEPSTDPDHADSADDHADHTDEADTNAAPEDAAANEPAGDDAKESLHQAEQLEERVIAASQAAVPVGLLAQLKSKEARSNRQRLVGRSGASQYSLRRGRPAGVRAGNPQRDGRLNIMATLQAAAPWQRLRRAAQRDSRSNEAARIRIEPADFRVTRYRQRARTLVVFAVDASGSSALHRLAEAKGAVELVLADCYVRRDQVAVIGFRGQSAEILLPPTRSLVRAKTSLAGLPGGGGTPLAAGIAAAFDMASKAQRRGDTPSILLLTDGRANVGFMGSVGREAAYQDALRAAAAVKFAEVRALFIDTSPRPSPAAKAIAAAMGARYIPLPSSDSRRILQAVKAES